MNRTQRRSQAIQEERTETFLKHVTLTGKGESIRVGNISYDGRAKRSRLICVGDHVTLNHGVSLLVHDALGLFHDGRMKYGKIILEPFVNIGTHSILLPGIRIGRGSLVAAGSVVYSGTDIPPREVWGGNPARKLCSLDKYLEKRKAQPARTRKSGIAPLETILGPPSKGLAEVFEEGMKASSGQESETEPIP